MCIGKDTHKHLFSNIYIHLRQPFLLIGISRNLGLCMSRSEGHLPAVPSPKSWTPSPPCGLNLNNAAGAVARNFSHHVQKNAGQVYCTTAYSCASKLRSKSNLHYIQGNTCSYHPGYNTPVNDSWSLRPAHSSSSSHHTGPTYQPPDQADQQTFKDTSHGMQYHRRWRRPTPYTKEPDKYSRSRGQDFYHSNRYPRRSKLEQDAEPPDACSSYRGSPHPRHHSAMPSAYQQQPCRHGAAVRHHLEPFQRPVCSDFPECSYKKQPDVYSQYERIVPLETLRGSRQEQENMSLTCHQTYPGPSSSITSTNPRRLWRKQCSFRSEALPATPRWVQNLQVHLGCILVLMKFS